MNFEIQQNSISKMSA